LVITSFSGPADALPAESGPHPAGATFGRFRLLARIGKGGMAEVFQAVSQGLQGFERVFVIKRIRPDRTDSAKFIQMFCDEARISALLHHPSIVQVYDFGHIDGAYFMAMEYLDGKDLATVQRALGAKRGALPPSLAALIGRDVARALHHAHTLVLPGGAPGGIVHRDVSPSNIMLLRAGGVRILDFGIAKAAAEARRHIQDAARPARPLGKLAYLSPEQVRGQAVDHRSDVFSLGIVLWEMVAGHRLFSGADEQETMRNVLLQPIAAPSRRRAGIPAALDAIIARALVREPGGRYPSAAEMADDLDRLLGETPCGDQVIPQLLKNLFDGQPDPRAQGEEAVSATFSASGSAPPGSSAAGAGTTVPDPVLEESAPVTELDAPRSPAPIPRIRLVTAILFGLAAIGWALFAVLSF
jgi:serine/threonine-protein kinase